MSMRYRIGIGRKGRWWTATSNQEKAVPAEVVPAD
jgi:hypothetical protein